jgi:hypothetical protein
MNKITIDLDDLPEIPGYDREAQKSIVKYLTTGEADMWEFWNSDACIAKGPLIGYHIEVCYCYQTGHDLYSHARPVKPFDTRLGKLTDTDSMNGNTPHRRPLVVVDSFKQGLVLRLFGVRDGISIVSSDNVQFASQPDIDTIRLATPDEVSAAGYPREWAGLREE